MASSFQFRNINTYVVEPEGEPIQSLPSKSSLDFSPQSSCIEEAPNDGKQYVRQNESWQEPNKENILGIKITDSPEFADTQITQLATEASYTPTVWSYLVGLFTTVPKSVKEHIVKIWSRLQLLEDQYILKYVVPVDTASIDLTTDRYGNAFNFVEGEHLLLIVKIPEWVQVTGLKTQLLFRFNGVTSAIYNVAASVGVISLSSLSASRYSEYLQAYINCYDGEVIGVFDAQFSTTGADLTASSRQFHTSGLNDNLKVINISVSGSTSLIPSGSIILIKKI